MSEKIEEIRARFNECQQSGYEFPPELTEQLFAELDRLRAERVELVRFALAYTPFKPGGAEAIDRLADGQEVSDTEIFNSPEDYVAAFDRSKS